MSANLPDADSHLIEWARRQAARARSASSSPSGLGGGVAALSGTHRMIEGGRARYEIHRELHRGGQGVVYLATQLATRREVAIKFLRSGPLAGLADRARFEREIQILSGFRHPGIVTIHDSGLTDDAFYYVMDYIDGIPIDRYVADRSLSPRQTMAFLAEVADAVAAAHLRGVIHRDLKPGNILIDAEGRPRLLDFGLARRAEVDERTDDMTQTGQFVGSLPWASPEQAEGRKDALDTRTDVYSLGVLGYKLLTGIFPYSVDGPWRDVCERICTQVPRPPSAIRPDIEADIDTLILKCLEKEPEQRYQTAAELSADLRRYLAGEPILARRESALKMLRRTVRRYRTAVAAGAAFLVVVVASAVALGVLYQRQSAERDRAEQQTAAAIRERERAEAHAAQALARFRMARDTAAFMLNQVSQNLLNLAGASEVRRELLRKTYEQFSTLTAESSDDPLLRLEIARTHLRLSSVARNDLGDAAQADEHLEAASQIVDSLLAADAEDVHFLALQAGLLSMRGGALEAAGDLNGAMALYEQENGISRRLYEKMPDQVSAMQRLSGSCGRLATIAQRRGDIESAARWITRSNELAQRLMEASPGNPDFVHYAALGESRLGDFAFDAANYDAAERHFAASLTLCEEVLARHAGDMRFLYAASYALMRLTAICWRAERMEEHERHLRRKQSLNREMHALEPRNPVFRLILGGTCLDVARLEMFLNRPGEAEAPAMECSELLRVLIESEPGNKEYRQVLAASLCLLGAAAVSVGDSDQALARLHDAREIYSNLWNRETDLRLLCDFAGASIDLAHLNEQRGAADAAAEGRRLARELVDAIIAAADRLGDRTSRKLAERLESRL